MIDKVRYVIFYRERPTAEWTATGWDFDTLAEAKKQVAGMSENEIQIMKYSFEQVKD